MPLREFSIPLALLLIALMVYLLIAGRLSQWGFAGALLGVAAILVVVGVILPRYEDVSEVAAKTQWGEMSVKMERIRDEVYAKAESVREMAEVAAEATVFSMARVGRFGSETLDAELLAARERLKGMLKKIGTSNVRADEITTPLTNAITHDLATEVFDAVQKAIRERKEAPPIDMAGLGTEVVRRLKNSEPGQAESAVRPYLESVKAWSPEVQTRIAAFEGFRKTGRLPTKQQGGAILQ